MNRLSSLRGRPSSSYHNENLELQNVIPEYKVIVIGDIDVGKTCLAFKFCDHLFPEKTVSTIGFDFHQKVISFEEESLKLQVWDTAGSERYRGSIMPHYYRNAAAIIIVFDITRRSSFENLRFWLEEAGAQSEGSPLPVVLVGNKCDREQHRQVSDEEAQNLADEHGLRYFAVSAKEDGAPDKVDDVFEYVGKKILESRPRTRVIASNNGRPKGRLSILADTGSYVQSTHLGPSHEPNDEHGNNGDMGLQEYRRVLRTDSLPFDGIVDAEEETEDSQYHHYSSCCHR